MSDIIVGSVAIEVIPDARLFVPRLREDLEGAGPGAIGEDIGRQIGDRITPLVSDSITKGIDEGGAKSAPRATGAGETSGGFFAEAFRRQVQAALEHLPEPNIGVDATEADAELAHIREELRALGDAHIGVDIDAAAALVRIDEIRARLDELGARSPDIRVQVDAAQAEAELAAIQSESEGVGTSSAAGASGVSGMLSAIALLGPAIIPIAAAGIGALAGIGAAALAAAGGIGVLALAFSGVAKAVQLLGQEQQDQAAASAQDAAQAAAQAASEAAASRQLQSAEASLANTRANNASAQVAAAGRVQSAEAALTAANQQAADAQKALNDAREQATRDLEDLANREADAQLAVRQASLDLGAARANQLQVDQSATSTALQRQQAALSVTEAEQRLTEARQASTRATEDNNKAQAAGVTGTPAYISAQQQASAATQAQKSAVQGVTDAQRAAVEQQRSAAFAISQAQGQVANAMAAVANAARSSGAAGTTALAKVQEQLAALPAATVALATIFEGTVLPIFRTLQGVASAGLTPGITKFLADIRPLIGPLTTFVGGLASTMGDLFAKAGQALTAPFWTQFFGWVSSTAGPILETMARFVGGIAQGFAGLLQAFGPVISQIGRGLAGWAQSFANLGAHAGSNSGVQSFIRYVEKVGPQVARTLEALGGAFLRIAAALAPLGPPILAIFRDIAAAIQAIPLPVLTALGLVVADLVLEANPMAAVAVAIGLIVAAIVELVKHWGDILRGLEVAGSAIASFFEGLPGRILGWLKDAGAWLLQAGKDIIHGLWLGFEYLTPEGEIIKWHTQILHALAAAGTWLVNIGGDIISGLWRGITAAWAFLGDIGKTVKGWFTTAFHDAVHWLVDVGKDVVRGLADGMLRFVEDTVGHIPFIGGRIVKMFKDALGIHSPSAVFFDIGQNLMEGLAGGITAYAHLPGAALASMGLAVPTPALAYNGTGTGPSYAPATVTSAMTAPRGGGVHIEHLEVKGQDRPQATGRELIRELNKNVYLRGGR